MVDDGTEEVASRGDIANLRGNAGGVSDRGGGERCRMRGYREASFHENHDYELLLIQFGVKRSALTSVR